MITEQALVEAIAECQGVRNPNAGTCIKLASYYAILDRIRGEDSARYNIPAASFSASPQPVEKPTIGRISDSEFAALVDGMDTDTVMGVMDELMTTLQAVMPRLYEGVLRKLQKEREG